MREYLLQYMGEEAAMGVQFMVALLAVLLLFGLFVWFLRLVTGKGRRTATSQNHRLAVLDRTQIDDTRSLVLLRRDDMEHLVMIGGPSDVVVESNIDPYADEADRLAGQPLPGHEIARRVIAQRPLRTMSLSGSAAAVAESIGIAAANRPDVSLAPPPPQEASDESAAPDKTDNQAETQTGSAQPASPTVELDLEKGLREEVEHGNNPSVAPSEPQSPAAEPPVAEQPVAQASAPAAPEPVVAPEVAPTVVATPQPTAAPQTPEAPQTPPAPVAQIQPETAPDPVQQPAPAQPTPAPVAVAPQPLQPEPPQQAEAPSPAPAPVSVVPETPAPPASAPVVTAPAPEPAPIPVPPVETVTEPAAVTEVVVQPQPAPQPVPQQPAPPAQAEAPVAEAVEAAIPDQMAFQPAPPVAPPAQPEVQVAAQAEPQLAPQPQPATTPPAQPTGYQPAPPRPAPQPVQPIRAVAPQAETRDLSAEMENALMQELEQPASSTLSRVNHVVRQDPPPATPQTPKTPENPPSVAEQQDFDLSAGLAEAMGLEPEAPAQPTASPETSEQEDMALEDAIAGILSDQPNNGTSDPAESSVYSASESVPEGPEPPMDNTRPGRVDDEMSRLLQELAIPSRA